MERRKHLSLSYTVFIISIASFLINLILGQTMDSYRVVRGQGQGVTVRLRVQPDQTTAGAGLLDYSIVEGQPAGLVLANIKWDSSLASRYSPRDSALLRFALRRPSGAAPAPAPLFKIDAVTGVLSTADVIDRESVCSVTSTLAHSAGRGCDVFLDVVVTPVDYYTIIRVMVHIIDINDNVPSFPVDRVRVEINESTRPGSLFVLPPAEDTDSLRYSIQSYR